MLTQFQKDLKTMTLNEALTQHNLTLKEAFTTLHHQLLYAKQQPKKSNPQNKYIQNRENKYYIRKWVNGETKQFGTYHNLKDARLIRDKCVTDGWIQKNIDDYCKELNIIRCENPKSKERYH